MSAILLGFLPPGIGFLMYTLNPGYMSNLFHDSLGKTMLVGASVLAVVGFLWMKKMIEIEA
jgi:tight adherence protein B